MQLKSVIPFALELEKFKTCLRTCKTSMPGRGESDAEHSWHLAAVLMLLEDDFPELDFYQVLKLALIHDLPEIYAGDTNPYRDNVQNKAEKELQSAKQLYSLLPGKLQHKMWQLFEEYEHQSSEEARLVKRIDKLMPLLQNLCTNRNYSSYRALEVNKAEARTYLEPYFPAEAKEAELFELLFNRANEAGVFAVE